MEAASRPASEPLPDLPVEEPADRAPAKASRPEAAPSAAAAPATAPKPEPAEPDHAATQTLLKMELLVGDGETLTPAPAAATASPASAPTLEAAQVLDLDPSAPLTLEETQADRMLSSPPAPKPAAAPLSPSAAAPTTPKTSSLDETSTFTLSPDFGAPPAGKAAAPAPAPVSKMPASAAKSPAAESAPETPAFVPLAKRATLTAAAMKLAAASAAGPQAAAPPKPAAPAGAAAAPKSRAPTGAVASVTPITKTPSSAAAAAAPAATAAPSATASAAPATPTPTPPADAPSLASWASARAAAASSARTAPPAAARAGTAPAAKATSQAMPERRSGAAAPPGMPERRSGAAASAAAPAAPSTPPATPPVVGSPPRGMDRDFIARNQVVERYLSGKLPIKAATDFERYCKEHPQLLDELGLPERVNAGLRLLEASGKPEPWQEASKPIWQQPAVILGLGAVAVVLAVALSLVAVGSAGKTHKIIELQRQVADRTLDAATSTRVVRLMPSRSGASNTPAIVIGGGEAQLMDFRIDETRSPYKDFRVTIDRVDQGRVMVIDNLSKDSNGHLRLAVNSSAFGPGNYQLTIEGLTMRLEPQPDSWVTIGVVQR
jgi:hypothetical protein